MNTEKPKSRQPIPQHAKKVFEGKLFDVFQWEQKLYDGSKGIFEKVQRTDTTDVIAITEDGKVIVLEQEQPGKGKFFSLPGGSVDRGEDPVDNAKRELLEETGYEAGEISLWHSIQQVSKIDWALYIFVAKNCKKVSDQNLDSGEKIKVLLVSMEEFVDMIIDQKIILTALNMQLLKEDLLVIDRSASHEKIKKYFQ